MVGSGGHGQGSNVRTYRRIYHDELPHKTINWRNDWAINGLLARPAVRPARCDRISSLTAPRNWQLYTITACCERVFEAAPFVGAYLYSFTIAWPLTHDLSYVRLFINRFETFVSRHALAACSCSCHLRTRYLPILAVLSEVDDFATFKKVKVHATNFTF